MDIAAMHVWFRQYAQQMGIQNHRAILPEQIDLLINTSISDIVNQIIKENIGITNDRVITDNSKIGQINALRTLYKVKEIDLFPYKGTGEDTNIYYTFNFDKNQRFVGKISTNNNNLKTGETALPDYLFIVDFSLSYKKVEKGYIVAKTANKLASPPIGNGDETNYFPVRLIDDAYLADTLNDFILKPRLRSPIIVTYNSDVFDIYIEPFIKEDIQLELNPPVPAESYVLQNNLLPYKLRFSYIAKPAEVKYRADLLDENVNCDLPESWHVDVLKHAVDLYRIAVSGSLHASQQQEQAQQQENVRNNYRNEQTQ